MRIRIYIFLVGFHHNLDQVSGQILDASPLPSLEEAYLQVHREDNSPWELKNGQKCRLSLSKRITLGQHLLFVLPTLFLISTLTITTQRHTKDVCWKKHGYPKWYKLKQTERRIKNLHKLRSQLLLHLLLLM